MNKLQTMHHKIMLKFAKQKFKVIGLKMNIEYAYTLIATVLT